MLDQTMSARQVIEMLELQPHPEGGHYRQTFQDRALEGNAAGEVGRAASTAIYFLLKAGERSHWHRVDATEIWHFYAGAPLVLSLAQTDAGPARDVRLGPDLGAGALPQHIVPEGFWQAARSTGDWTLVGCTVSPGFHFDGFELAPEGFEIP